MYNAMYMPAMIRKQFYIEPSQDRQLKRMAKRTGKTEAEIVREALSRLVEEQEREKDRLKVWEEQKAFMRQWMAKGPVPASGRTWTREELHERGRSGGH